MTNHKSPKGGRNSRGWARHAAHPDSNGKYDYEWLDPFDLARVK